MWEVRFCGGHQRPVVNGDLAACLWETSQGYVELRPFWPRIEVGRRSRLCSKPIARLHPMVQAIGTPVGVALCQTRQNRLKPACRFVGGDLLDRRAQYGVDVFRRRHGFTSSNDKRKGHPRPVVRRRCPRPPHRRDRLTHSSDHITKDFVIKDNKAHAVPPPNRNTPPTGSSACCPSSVRGWVAARLRSRSTPIALSYEMVNAIRVYVELRLVEDRKSTRLNS